MLNYYPDILKDKTNKELSLTHLVEEYMISLCKINSYKIVEKILPTKSDIWIDDIEHLSKEESYNIRFRDAYKSSYIYFNRDNYIVKDLKDKISNYLKEFFGQEMGLSVPYFDSEDYIEYSIDGETGDILVDELKQLSIVTKLSSILKLMELQGLDPEEIPKEELNKEIVTDYPIDIIIKLVSEPFRLNYFGKEKDEC